MSWVLALPFLIEESAPEPQHCNKQRSEVVQHVMGAAFRDVLSALCAGLLQALGSRF
jgi:hypothetical protein